MKNNPHFFLAEEVLIPNANKTDPSRLNMVSSHLNQFLTLVNSEKPLVFTNFENQVGKYSRAYKKIPSNATVIGRYELNPNNITYVFELDGVLDVIQYNSTTCLTENYGYKNNLINDLQVNDVVDKETLVYRNDMYDDDLNMQIGVNLRSVFLAYKGLTFEDASVISKSAAKKLSHTEVNEIFVTLNNNDILINWYGNEKNYVPFPSIGQPLKNGILCVRRRINYNFILDDFKTHNFQNINIQDDTVFYCDGIVENIEVYSNMSTKESNYTYNKFIVDLEANQKRWYTEVYEGLKEFKENNFEFSDNLNFLYQKAKDYLNKDLKFSYEGKEFEGTMLKFTISKTVEASIGSKVSGRYGNKG